MKAPHVKHRTARYRPRHSTSPNSPSKTGVNALMVGEVDARSASGGDFQVLYFMKLSDRRLRIAST